MLAEMLRTNCLQYISGMGPLLFRYVRHAGVGRPLGPNVSCYPATAIYRRALRECSAKPPLNYWSCVSVCTVDGTLRGQSKELDEYLVPDWSTHVIQCLGWLILFINGFPCRDDFVSRGTVNFEVAWAASDRGIFIGVYAALIWTRVVADQHRVARTLCFTPVGRRQHSP